MEQLLLKLLTSNPEEFAEMVNGYIKKYKPIVYSVCKELFEIVKDYADNKDVCQVTARHKKNMFDAYISVGFTEEQAIAFIINDNLQLIKNIEKINNPAKIFEKNS